MPVTRIDLDIRETTTAASPADAAADVLLVPAFTEKNSAGETIVRWNDALKDLNERSNGALQSFLEEESFGGAFGKSLYLPSPSMLQGIGAKRVIVFGCGNADLPAHRLEAACTKALSAHLRLDQIGEIGVVAAGMDMPFDSALLALGSAIYQHTYRSREARKDGPRIGKVIFYVAQGNLPAQSQQMLAEIAAMCTARGITQDLVNMPSNIKRTDTMVNEAESLEARGLELDVVSDVRWIQEHMPCFFTVARGSLSSDPPKWIRLRYKPQGEIKRRLALVGKSVIFDTGGYQIKPGEFMNTMKADMAGGAAVLGVMYALSELKPPGLEVRAYLAATPNMIDADAMLPDSIVDTTCGKKVEIRHTDAEGRLTLIDAIAMAEQDEPEAIVTTATLTGAASRAVGMSIALMSRREHESWRDRMEAAARRAGDRVQVLDLAEEDFEDIASKLDGADIINTMQGKMRGAQTAAAFVMNGVPEDRPVIHLDIAGGDMSSDDKATGIATRSILRFLLHHV